MGMTVQLLLLLAVLHTAAAREQCFNQELCNKINYFELDLETNDNDISLKWSYNSSTGFYGFRVKIYDSDDATVFESPILHISMVNMNFEEELPNGKNYLCLQVLYNSSLVIAETCEQIKITDLKMFVGILAGAIFLIPCVIVLAFFIYKDKQIRNSSYEKLGHGHQNKSYTSNEDVAVVKSAGSGQTVVHNNKPIPDKTTVKRPRDSQTSLEIIVVASLEHKPEPPLQHEEVGKGINLPDIRQEEEHNITGDSEVTQEGGKEINAKVAQDKVGKDINPNFRHEQRQGIPGNLEVKKDEGKEIHKNVTQGDGPIDATAKESELDNDSPDGSHKEEREDSEEITVIEEKGPDNEDTSVCTKM